MPADRRVHSSARFPPTEMSGTESSWKFRSVTKGERDKKKLNERRTKKCLNPRLGRFNCFDSLIECRSERARRLDDVIGLESLQRDQIECVLLLAPNEVMKETKKWTKLSLDSKILLILNAFACISPARTEEVMQTGATS